jgi:hypothetical protein
MKKNIEQIDGKNVTMAGATDIENYGNRVVINDSWNVEIDGNTPEMNPWSTEHTTKKKRNHFLEKHVTVDLRFTRKNTRIILRLSLETRIQYRIMNPISNRFRGMTNGISKQH